MKHQQLSSQILVLLLVSICLCSCQKNHTSKQQAQELEQKIDLLNSQLTTLEKTLTNKDNAVLFLCNEIRDESLEKENRHRRKLEQLNNPSKYSCILNVRNIHQAVRAHQDLNSLEMGAPIVWKDIIGPEKYMKTLPTCRHKKYILSGTFPMVGTPAATCPHSKKLGHHPKSTEGW